MKIKELEKKINSLAPEGFELKVKELSKEGTSTKFTGNALSFSQNYKGEIIIYVIDGEHENEIIKIIPPHDEIETWYVDLSTNFCLFDTETLPIYIKILNTVLKFLKEK